MSSTIKPNDTFVFDCRNVSYMPYYLARVSVWGTRGGNVAIKVTGKWNKRANNPALVVPTIYAKLSAFDLADTPEKIFNVALHCARCRTLKIEGYWDHSELVADCRPFRETHGDTLRDIGQSALEVMGKDWKYDREKVALVRQAVKMAIPAFPR